MLQTIFNHIRVGGIIEYNRVYSHVSYHAALQEVVLTQNTDHYLQNGFLLSPLALREIIINSSINTISVAIYDDQS